MDATLAAYGWDDRWAALFSPFALRDNEPGRVVRHDRVAFVVATRRGLVHLPARRTVGPLTVGDWVVVEQGEIVDLLERASLLRRRAPEAGEQLLAANVDVVAMVFGADRPLKAGRLYRTRTQVWDAGATPLVVLTKTDLADCADALILLSDVTAAEDWPLSYDDLEPWYGRAEDELGVSGADVPQLGAALGPVPDAGHPAVLSRPSLCPRRPPARAAGDAHTAGAEQCPARRPPGLLRQLELHPHLPDRREVRRDGARRARREARSSPAGLVRRTEGGGGKCRIRDISPAGRQRAHGHGPHARPRRKRDRGRS